MRKLKAPYATFAGDLLIQAIHAVRRNAQKQARLSVYLMIGNPAAMVVAAGLQAGWPHPPALTPIGKPVGLVMS